MKKHTYVMSVDAETDGLWGKSFAIAAIVYHTDDIILSKFTARVPDSFVSDKWVKDNVLPTLENNFPVTHETREEMLADFASWYMKMKDNGPVLWHMGHIVEAKLFRELVELKLIGEFDAPYCPIEVSSILESIGYYKSDSVDSYAKENNLKISDYGNTHNPLYDCEVAAKVYLHIYRKSNPIGTKQHGFDYNFPG